MKHAFMNYNHIDEDIILDEMIKKKLIKYSDLKNANADEYLFTKMEEYVLQHHKHSITHMAGKHPGHKTTIGSPRVQVESITYAGLVRKLFIYYFFCSDWLATFDTVMEWYLDSKKLFSDVEGSTLARNRATYNKFATETLRSLCIKDITRDMLYEEIRAGIQFDIDKNKVNPRYTEVRSFIHIVRETFNEALRKGIISEDPSIGLRVEQFRKSCADPIVNADDKVISPDDIQKLITRITRPCSVNCPYSQGIRLASLTGMRVGELAALTWKDVEDDTDIHIHRQKIKITDKNGKFEKYRIVNYLKEERGQSKGGRRFPITPEIHALLEEIRATQILEGTYSEDGYVLHAKINPEGSISPDRYEKYIREHSHEALGFSISNHVLRMSLNSNILMNKLTIAERSLILGHTPEVNLKNYSHAGSYNYPGIREKLAA